MSAPGKPTSHDLMRQAMAREGITERELVDHIAGKVGGERARIEAAVRRFVDGGPSCMAVAIAIVSIGVEQQQATRQ